MSARSRAALAVVLLGLALGAIGCEDPQGFVETTKIRETFMDVSDQIVDGQRRLEFRVNVPGGVTHPSFEGLWTFRNPERPLFLYIVRAAEYDSGADPTTLPNFFMMRSDATSIHVHPTPGEWVIALVNPAAFGPATRSEVSGQVQLSYWR